jgi:hypothetical protein
MLALALPMAVLAQSKPDFSGTWTLNTEKSDPPPQRGGGGGGGRGPAGPVTIKMTANELTIQTEGRNGPQTLTYKLDGTESTNSMMGRGGVATEVKSKAKWDGSKIAIETTRDMGGNMVTITEVRSLSADGKEMTVETTNGDNKRKTVYSKGM